jgi:hypothetical protein
MRNGNGFTARTEPPVTRIVVLVALTLLCGVGPARAQAGVAAEEVAVHVVRPGDTLWDLARRYLENPYLWPEIFRANREVVRNPDLIFPADRLRIPGTATGRAFIAGQTGVVAGADRTVFFLPAVAPVLTSTIRPLEAAEIPVVTPGDYFRAGMLVPEREIVPLGRLAEAASATVVPIALPTQVALYERVFLALGAPGVVRPGDRLQLLRAGRRVQPHGRIHHVTGLATVLSVEGSVATVEVDRLYDQVAIGDLAVPLPTFAVPAGVVPQPAGGVEARIVAFEHAHPLQTPQEVAFLDVGRGAGVVEGDEFDVVLPRQQRSWGVRPEIRVGRVQVVRVGERTSAVRVVSLEQPALEPGLPVRLVGKMP